MAPPRPRRTARENRYGVSTAKAAGPMQFTPDTWIDYGVDANGDGKKDWLDLEDALHAAAKNASC